MATRKAPAKAATAKRPRKAAPKKAAPKERFVVLMRHGIAEELSEGVSDDDRALTAEGNDRMKENARGLSALIPRAEAIFSSPLLRAVQTALWVSTAYKSKLDVNTTDAMRPEATVDELRAFIDGLAAEKVILVGHEPGISRNALALAGMSGALEIRKGGACALRFDASGGVSLIWIVTPKVLRKLR